MKSALNRSPQFTVADLVNGYGPFFAPAFAYYGLNTIRAAQYALWRESGLEIDDWKLSNLWRKLQQRKEYRESREYRDSQMFASAVQGGAAPAPMPTPYSIKRLLEQIKPPTVNIVPARRYKSQLKRVAQRALSENHLARNEEIFKRFDFEGVQPLRKWSLDSDPHPFRTIWQRGSSGRIEDEKYARPKASIETTISVVRRDRGLTGLSRGEKRRNDST
jgi:hypothetical protein